VLVDATTAAINRLLALAKSWLSEEASGAGDVVVVLQKDQELEATAFLADLGQSCGINCSPGAHSSSVKLTVNGKIVDQTISVRDGRPQFDSAWPVVDGMKGAVISPGPELAANLDMSQSSRLHGAALRKLGLKRGRNEISYSWPNAGGMKLLEASIFLMEAASRVVVVNLDGFVQRGKHGCLIPATTVFESSSCTRTLRQIAQNGYHFLYVSSRFSVARATEIRRILFQDLALPNMPVILDPTRPTSTSLEGQPRMSCQRFTAEVLRELRAAHGHNPFVALFTTPQDRHLDQQAVAAPRSRSYFPDADSPSGWASGIAASPLETEVIELAFPKLNSKACFGFVDYSNPIYYSS